jgi:AcrR family transcriptional regulator
MGTRSTPGEGADTTGQTSAQPAEAPQYLVARADKRERSRRRVEKVALAMFAKRGFDAVTVDQICAASQIAPATFYRYFGSKEGVIFRYQDDFLAVAREIGGSVDQGVPPIDQVRHIVQRCVQFFEYQSEIRVLRDEIVLANDGLRQRTFAIERQFEDVLATALAAVRRESQPSAGTLTDAAISMLVLRLALIRWRYENDTTLEHITQEVYELLTSRLSQPAASAGPGT